MIIALRTASLMVRHRAPKLITARNLLVQVLPKKESGKTPPTTQQRGSHCPNSRSYRQEGRTVLSQGTLHNSGTDFACGTKSGSSPPTGPQYGDFFGGVLLNFSL